MKDVQSFLGNFKAWAENQENIVAVILVGSYARGTAKEDSDIDLMILAKNPMTYLQNTNWIYAFGEIKSIEQEDYHPVIAKRVFFKNGLEVEFDFASVDWVRTDPIDKGTERVMKDGYMILLDKNSVVKAFVEKLK